MPFLRSQPLSIVRITRSTLIHCVGRVQRHIMLKQAVHARGTSVYRDINSKTSNLTLLHPATCNHNPQLYVPAPATATITTTMLLILQPLVHWFFSALPLCVLYRNTSPYLTHSSSTVQLPSMWLPLHFRLRLHQHSIEVLSYAEGSCIDSWLPKHFTRTWLCLTMTYHLHTFKWEVWMSRWLDMMPFTLVERYQLHIWSYEDSDLLEC
jgi:hypothetical protein